MCGVHFIIEKGMESILVLFTLKTDNTERIIAAILPLPFNTIDNIINNLNQKFSKDKTLSIQCLALDPKADYLTEAEEMKKISNWIEKMKMNH